MKRLEKEDAWTGDAVLALFARKWILDKEKKMDAEMFTRMTSNNFLNCIGNPTKVEAEIGKIYNQHGIIKSFQYIEKELLLSLIKPLYL